MYYFKKEKGVINTPFSMGRRGGGES